MNLTPIIKTLDSAIESDEPTTKKAAEKLGESVKETLTELREYVKELDEALGEAENAAENLPEADKDDRQDAFNEFTGALQELRDRVDEIIVI